MSRRTTHIINQGCNVTIIPPFYSITSSSQINRTTDRDDDDKETTNDNKS